MAPRYLALLALLPFVTASAEMPQEMGTSMAEELTAPASIAAEAMQAGPAVITTSQAAQAIDAAVKKAAEIKVPMNIAIMDPFGHLVSFTRMDGAALASIEVAQKKARTVSMFNGRYRTADLFNATSPGGPLYGISQTNGGLLFFGGGIPVKSNGQFIGSVGVSGGAVDQDVQVASAAAAVFK